MSKDNKKLVAHINEPMYDDIEGFEGKNYKSSLTDENIEELTDFEGKTIYETLEMYKKLKEYITSDFEVLEEYFYSSKEMLKDSNKVMRRNYIIMGLAALKYTILTIFSVTFLSNLRKSFAVSSKFRAWKEFSKWMT